MFSFYTLTPGRRIYVLRTVVELTAATLAKFEQLEGDEAEQLAGQSKLIIEAAEAAIAQDRKALDLDAARLDPDAPTRVRDKDLVVDRILVGIDANLELRIGLSDDDTAVQLQTTLFPGGVTHHTRLAFVEQSSANERVLEILEGPTHAQWLQTYGFTPLVKDLRKAHDAFETALKRRDAHVPTTWEAVKAARVAGQELYLETIVRILSTFLRDAETRDKLMQPIWTEEERVRSFRRTRPGGLLDVNPETGELLLPPGEQVANDEPVQQG